MAADPRDVLSKAEYADLRTQLEFRPNPWMTVLVIAMNTSLLALALHLLSRPSVLGYCVAQLLLPIVFFQAFSLLHDCAHGSCTTSRWGNTLIGHCASVLCFMPYFPWKYIHTEHHVWAGNIDRDPGLALVKRARDTRKLPWPLTAGWRTWFPLGGFAQHIVYWSYPVTALRQGSLSRGKLIRCAGSVALLVGVYSTLHPLAPTLFKPSNFGPAILLYLMLVELVNLPHHVGLTTYNERLPLWQQHLPTRSCDYPPVISEVLVLNFNFHIEHHLFPNLAWYRLRTARRLLRAKLGVDYRQADGVAWQIRERRKGLVDVLVGTQPPDGLNPRNSANSTNTTKNTRNQRTPGESDVTTVT